MATKKIQSVKEAFENSNIKITSIQYGRRGLVRVDAERKFTGERLSKWVREDYVNRLCLERYGKKLSELEIVRY